MAATVAALSIGTAKGSQIHRVSPDVAFLSLPIGARADKNPGPMAGSFIAFKMSKEKRLNHQYVEKLGEYI